MPAETKPTCPDCGVNPGEEHRPGCDVERCSVCKRQFLSCGHENHDPSKTKWNGEWPGVAECKEKGWYVLDTPGSPTGYWTPCKPGTPGAMEDLNRLAYFEQAGWDGLYFDPAFKPKPRT